MSPQEFAQRKVHLAVSYCLTVEDFDVVHEAAHRVVIWNEAYKDIVWC